MRLTRKHIGQIFDVRGGDGSWVYQLMDVRKGELLFYGFAADRYEIDDAKYNDWQPFEPQKWWSKTHKKMGWQIGRRSIYKNA